MTTDLFARGARGFLPTSVVAVGNGSAFSQGSFEDTLKVTRLDGAAGDVELRVRLTLESHTTYSDRPVCPADTGVEAQVETELPRGFLTIKQRCNDGPQARQAEMRVRVHVPAGGEAEMTLKGLLKARADAESNQDYPHDVSARVEGPIGRACRATENPPDGLAARTVVNVDVLTDGGHYEATSDTNYRTDSGPPVTAPVVSPPPSVAGWNRGNASVRLDASDASGVESITYTATGANPIPRTTVDRPSTDVPITAEGQTTLEYSATDCHGNEEPAWVVRVRIDKQPPTVTSQARFDDGTHYGGGWTKQPVTVYFTCSDATSGLADACPSPVRVDNDSPSAAGTTVSSGPVADRAGHVTTESTVVKLDTQAPAVTHLVAQRGAVDGFPQGAPYESGTWSNSDIWIWWDCVDTGPAGSAETAGAEYFTDRDAAGHRTPREFPPFTPRCRDRAGNVGESDEWIVRVDSTRWADQYPLDFALAMAADPSLITGASIVTRPSTVTVGVVGTGFLHGAGTPMPSHGTSAAAMSTGSVYNPLEGSWPGEALAAPGATPERGEYAFDVTTVKIDVLVPEGASCIGFDAELFGSQGPDDDGNGEPESDYDQFVAELDHTTWTAPYGGGVVIAPDSFASGTRTPVTPGPHSLYLSIFDVDDALGNGTVLLDNLQANTDC